MTTAEIKVLLKELNDFDKRACCHSIIFYADGSGRFCADGFKIATFNAIEAVKPKPVGNPFDSFDGIIKI